MKLTPWAICLVLINTSPLLYASDLKFRGFASFTGGKTLGSDESLYGYDTDMDFRNDSLIALQSEANLQEGLSATIQIMARGRNGYKPDAEWAYISYDFDDHFRLNAGRMRLPFYRYSDFVDVRYTYNWLQPPKTVYGFEFPGYDGLSLVHTQTFGSWDSTFQFIYGRLEGELNTTPVTIEDQTGFSWSLVHDWLTLRAGYLQSKVNIEIAELETLAAGIETLGAATHMDLSGLASKMKVDGDKGSFGSLAMGIDYNNFLLDTEFITYKVNDSLLAKTDAYYISGGYRLGKWIPLLTFSKSKSDAPTELLNDIPPGLKGIPFGPATFEQVLAGAVAATGEEIDFVDVSLRYDFHSSAALKASVTQTDNNQGEKNSLLRVGIDLVF